MTLILYITFKIENIIPRNMCYDEMNVSIQKLEEIGSSTLSKMLKTLNTHNFLNIYQNILKLQLKMFVLTQGIQLKKNFCSST